MKPHQHLKFVRKGLLMTLFRDDNNLLDNFSLLFGDSDLVIERKENLGNGRHEYVITADTKETYPERYHRTFVVSVVEVENMQFYNYQIIGIDEC